MATVTVSDSGDEANRYRSAQIGLTRLLVLRVVQGAFGAPFFPMGQEILLASYSRAQHHFILMMWGVGGSSAEPATGTGKAMPWPFSRA